MDKVRKIAMYISLALTSAAFAAAGAAKLAGVEQMHLSFAAMGLPVWFGYFIGTCEAAGAVGLWLKRTSLYASTGLLIIMLGAIYYHVFYDAVANAFPAIVLSLLLLNIMVSRKRFS